MRQFDIAIHMNPVEVRKHPTIIPRAALCYSEQNSFDWGLPRRFLAFKRALSGAS